MLSFHKFLLTHAKRDQKAVIFGVMNKILYQLKTFRFAFKGIVTFFRIESKAYIHLFATLCALLLSWLLEISTLEWLFVILAIALVYITELFNTIAELMADLIQPGQDKRVAAIKDMAAGAVLLAALVALTIGIVIFLPKLIELL